ncbi:hypothetical protein ACPPVO_15265 [Dactylosporangium sp. McL0621]|uniref:hypothetical protein n=1 Tax=Dactylosporangium sp. McL0621 TaxID=3415678 RepID=UPI003CF06CCC
MASGGIEVAVNAHRERGAANDGEADLNLVYTRMSDAPGSKGIGAIVVPRDAPGVSFGAQEKLMGCRGIPSADIVFAR